MGVIQQDIYNEMIKRDRLDEIETYLFVGFASLAVIPVLYILRFLDDNTLTSWQWVFIGQSPGIFFLLLIPVIFTALCCSRLTVQERFLPWILFGSGFLVSSFLWSIPEVLLDASRYFLEAKYLKEYGPVFFLKQWGVYINPWTDLPLIPFLYGLLFKLFGEARIVAQVFNSVLFATAMVLTYQVGKVLWDKETGFWAGLLLLGVPYLPTQVPLLLVDVATMFFVLLAVVVYMKVLRHGGFLWSVASVVSIVLALLTKYSTWPILAGLLPIITLVHIGKIPGQILKRAATVAIGAGLLAVVLLFAKYEVFRDQFIILSTFQKEGLKRWQEGYISTFFFQIHPFITIAALLGTFRAIQKKDPRFLVAAWFAAFVFILHIKRMRYIVPLLPLFVLMAAYGLNVIRDVRHRRFIGYSTVFSALLVLFGAYKPFLMQTSMMNLKEAGAYLDSLPEESVSVHLLPQHEASGSTTAALPILDIYTDKKLYSSVQKTDHHTINVNKNTSLRFTWELSQPSFYSPAVPNGTTRDMYIASRDISSKYNSAFQLEKQILEKKFQRQTGVFRYKTLVTIMSQ